MKLENYIAGEYKNRDLYYQKSNDIRIKNDIIGWIKIFFRGNNRNSKNSKGKI